MNATETRTDMTVANTIFAQLGGPRFSAMTGCRDLVGAADSLTFKIGRAKDGINAVRITLDPTDTYTMTFFKIARGRGYKVTTVAEVSMVYSAQLRSIFTNHTGLYTSL